MNLFGPAGDGGQDDFGRRDREVGPVMLADPEKGKAELIGQYGHGISGEPSSRAGVLTGYRWALRGRLPKTTKVP